MPRKLRKVKQRMPLTLAGLGLLDVLCFVTCWSPPLTTVDRLRWRWQTWDEYFAEYDAIRDELSASPFVQPGQVPFAERIRQEMRDRPGEVYQAHFHSALRHAHWYEQGDEHVHEGHEARLGAATEVETCHQRKKRDNDGHPPGSR